jgi:hypothetical protein
MTEHHVQVKMRALWDTAPCSFVGADQHSEARTASMSRAMNTSVISLMMEAVHTSECQSTFIRPHSATSQKADIAIFATAVGIIVGQQLDLMVATIAQQWIRLEQK